MSKWFRRNRALYPDGWDLISDRIKTLAGWRCEVCTWPGGDHNSLGCHHVDFQPANCADDNLVCLCSRCHLRAHSRRYRALAKAALIVELRRRHEIELGQLCLPLTISEVPT